MSDASPFLSLDQVRDRLRGECRQARGYDKWAEANNLSADYVGDVLAARRPPGSGILSALGLECVVVYRVVGEKNA